MKNLFNRIFWRLTEHVYDEGMVAGKMIGAYFEREYIIKQLEDADSTCSDWAIAVIRNKQ